MSSDKTYQHTVFKNNPIHLATFIDQYVTINTKYNTTVSGFVEAIDPVSESVIVSTNIEGKISTTVVTGHSVGKIVIGQPPNNCTPGPKIVKNVHDKEDYNIRKLEVLSWLSKNLLPVKEVDGSLQIHNGVLSISPPYYSDNCISSNAIVLGRIQHLLNNMPKKDIST